MKAICFYSFVQSSNQVHKIIMNLNSYNNIIRNFQIQHSAHY